MASIYDHPEIYDLEHAEEEPDILFFQSMAEKLRPLRTLEVACGTGRVTRPLARTARQWGGQVWGMDSSEPMLQGAKRADDSRLATYLKADVRTLKVDESFDFVFSACASLSHLLTQADQEAAFRGIYSALKPGGMFVLAEVAPAYSVLAESMCIPPRETVQFDGDFTDGHSRLIRYRTARFHAHDQRLKVRYQYDYLPEGKHWERFINDYEAHVYFPAELRFLLRLAGFQTGEEWGDYSGGPFTHESRFLIFSGTRG